MTPPNNLPAQLTSFVGRQRELAEVARLLSRTRLLTISGAGGSGKSRIALELASNCLGGYPDGAYFVELASLIDASLLPQMVASTLGLREQHDRFIITTLTEQLRPRNLLLVLDNCEHLVQACASLVDTLLRAAPNLRIITTSRHVLNVDGEFTWSVSGLSFPTDDILPPIERLLDYEAVQLFVERAVFKRPDFALTPQNAPSVVRLCQHVDGLPLAIEMAAARVKTLSVEQIAERLGNSLNLLSQGRATALPRHRTLEATLDWSYRLLAEEEQHLLRSLSAFAGTFTLEAAHAVYGAGMRTGMGANVRSDIAVDASTHRDEYHTLDLFGSLIDKSMVKVEERAGKMRYRLLETVRQYTAARAYAHDESDALRHAHLAWYLSLAEEAQPNLEGHSQKAWLDLLEAEYDNLRKALNSSQEMQENAEAGLRLALALWRFWYIRGYLTEGRHWMEAALSRSAEALPTLRAQALAKVGLLANDQGDYKRASACLNESLDLFRRLGDRQGISDCLNYLGVLARNLGDYKRAVQLCEESLALQEELGSRSGIAACLNNLGFLAIEQGNYVPARSYVQRSLQIVSDLDDRMRIAIALNNLARIACALGDLASAAKLFSDSLAIRRELSDIKGIPISLSGLGVVASHQGDHVAARALFDESLQLYKTLADREGMAIAMNHLAELDLYEGNPAHAEDLLAQALDIARDIGARELTARVLANTG